MRREDFERAQSIMRRKEDYREKADALIEAMKAVETSGKKDDADKLSAIILELMKTTPGKQTISDILTEIHRKLMDAQQELDKMFDAI